MDKTTEYRILLSKDKKNPDAILHFGSHLTHSSFDDEGSSWINRYIAIDITPKLPKVSSGKRPVYILDKSSQPFLKKMTKKAGYKQVINNSFYVTKGKGHNNGKTKCYKI